MNTHHRSEQKIIATFILLFSVFCFVLSTHDASAVSLIAGVPNTETTRKNKLMLAHESQVPFQVGGLAPNLVNETKQWTGFNFLTFGVSDRLELASTFYNFTDPASQRIAGSLGYKWADNLALETPVFQEWRFTFGQEFLIALQGNEGLGLWSFIGVSNRLEITQTRFTLGASYGTRQMFGKNVFCAFAGIEQPLSKKWSIISDWFSGKHDLAALITAVQYKPFHALTIITGPKWANNTESGSNAWMLELTLDL